MLTLQDYTELFDLNSEDLKKPLLELNAGFTHVNQELYQQGGTITSMHPLYHLASEDLHTIMLNHYRITLEESSVFLHDYAQGKKEKRYQELNSLDFAFPHFNFHMALCHSVFFGYFENPLFKDSLPMIQALCKIAHEVRIYPVIDSTGKLPNELASLLQTLTQKNMGVEIKAVANSSHHQGHVILRVWAQTCEV